MSAPATTDSKIKGVTAPEFDKVSLPTLRAWLRYWKDEKRCAKDAAITADRPRIRHIALIEAEITARTK